MRRAALLLTMLLLSSCKSVTGPFSDSRRNRDRPDDPLFTIEEQKRRGAERLAIPEDDRNVSPPGYFSRPSPTGITR